MRNDKMLLQVGRKFHEIGDLYDELAKLEECENTPENEEKLATITGKIMLKVAEIEKINP